MCENLIYNIDISSEYDESLGTDDVHYQSFARMAAFFGRDMQAHRHERYFQMHFLLTGQIELQLDDHRYSVEAPLFVSVRGLPQFARGVGGCSFKGAESKSQTGTTSRRIRHRTLPGSGGCWLR